MKVSRISLAKPLAVFGLIAGAATSCRAATDLTAPPSTAPQPLAAEFEPPIWPVLDPYQTLRFDSYSVEQGLSQSSPLCLLQDAQGFLWIGTEDGLNRFDGVDFTVYRNDPDDPNSLSNSYVSALAEGPNGQLWVGTYGGGLNRLDSDSGSFTHFRHDDLDPNSIAHDQVLSLLSDRDGTLWVGMRGGGLDHFDPETGSFRHYASDPVDPGSLSHNDVRALAQDRTGAIWVGTSEGLNRLDPGSASFERFYNNSRDRGSLSADPVLSLFVTRAGELWIGTVRGLDRYLPDSDGFEHYPYAVDDPNGLSNPTVTAIVEDTAGALWIGTDAGLNYLDPGRRGFIRFLADPADPESISRSEIDSLLLDDSGGLWVGSYGGGLNRTDPRRAAFGLYRTQVDRPEGLVAASIWGIFEDSAGVLWIGTDGAGLQSFDRSSGDWEHYPPDPADPGSLASGEVMGVYEDHLGELWVSTAGGGLSRLDRESGQFTTYRFNPEDPASLSSDVVWFAREDSHDDLWVGTAWGLNRFDRANERFTHFIHDPEDPRSAADNNMGSFYEDSSGVIWVGTHGGLHRFDMASGQFQRYAHDPEDPTSLSHNMVFAIHQDAAGRLWVGTWGGGLNRFEPATQSFLHYRVRDGLPNDVVYGIMEDDQGYLWMTTNNGLSRFDPETEKFTNFDRADGLQSNEFSYNGYFRSHTGEMFVAGIGGFNAFYPASIAPSQFRPPIVVTSLTSGDRQFASGSELELAWPDNGFSFEYAALSFSQPGKSEYAYRLAGFEQDWNEVGTQRFGRYTNLPGGDYTLQIRGTNQDGIWNEAGASISISVTPPFWTSWWFVGLGLMLTAATIYGGFRLRLNAVEGRSHELEVQVSTRTEALEKRTQQLESRRRELEALYQADEQLLSRLELDEVLQALVDTAVDILGADKGGVLVQDEQTQELVIRAYRGFSPESFSHVTFRPGRGIAGRVFESGRPMAVEDTEREPHVTRAFVEAEGVRAFLQVPIKIGDEVYGVFSADYLEPREFDQATVQLLMSLASHAALALENARLYADTTQQIAQLTALQETTRAMASTLELNQLLELIIRQATTLLRADGGMINLVVGDEPYDEVVAAIGLAQHTVGNRSLLEGSLSGWVALHNEPVVVDELEHDQRIDRSDPELLQSIESAAVAPLAIKDQVFGTLVVLTGKRNQKGSFNQADLRTLVAFANQAAIAIENARLYESELRRAEQFQLLLDLGSRLTSILSPDDLRIQISRLVREALGYKQVSFGLIEGDQVVFHSGSGQFWDQLSREPLRLPIGGNSLSSWVAQHAEPLVVPDVHNDSRYFFLPGDTETRSEVVVPLRVQDVVIGVLAASSDRPNAFDDSDVAMLQTLADQSAIALENARLYTRAGEVAALEERARLARDLHDAVTQTLFSASLIAEALPTIWTDDPVEGGRLMQELRKLNTGALAEMRSLLLELRPAALEETDICDLLRQLGNVIGSRSGIEVQVETKGDCRVPGDVHVTLYRIAQEAMNNISKHAKASLVEVLLEGSVNGGSLPDSGRKAILLRIQDNGQGFDPQLVETEGLGLKIIRERAESIGAQLDIESKVGEGTTMLVRWEENGNV